ncbi:MAG TPA: DNA primase [Anaerolineae bacterium]|nr:DNA primase [Anaerolineae bacterium]HQK14897.1 DNA primase [Anaerolineae bacterium]
MSVVDEVKERLDIVEVIGRHVHLQKSGRYLKGLCPFHTEKTPSFYVFPDNQRWHCFGCNRGGDLFNFVMEFEGLDFRTALEELARRAGVELKPRTPEQVEAESEAERLRLLLETAAAYYHTLLLTAPQAAHARAYLQKRGFTRETIETFQLGYSLNEWDATRTYLFGKGFSVEDQIKAGMLVEKEGGGTFDRFRNRLMIPICDRRGRVIAFGGRVLNPDDQPKYMNSPQTVLFDKSAVLFGYHLASQAIQKADAAIIVEGYMDVMIPHQAGYKNVVAPMGTALTEAHLQQLQRLTRRFILALDPDTAGIHGTLQGLETARQTLDREWEAIFDPHGLVGVEGRLKADIRVITMPGGLDPDELILQDPARWEKLVAESQPVVRFYFDQLLRQENPQEPKGKARIVDAMLPLLSDIADSVEREAYVQDIALRLGLDARSLLDRLRVRERAQAVRRQAAVKTAGRTPLSGDLEAYALTILIRYPEVLALADAQLAEAQLEPIHDDDFSGIYRLIWSAWMELSAHPELELSDILPPDLLELVHTWIATPLPDTPLEQWKRDMVRTILRLRERRLRDISKRTQSLVAEAQVEGDMKAERYLATLKNLSEALRRIQQALSR